MAKRAGSSIVLPDGRCDVILRYNNAKKLPTAIVTGPAKHAYTVDFNKGDYWLGLRLRPDYGVLLWRDKITQASDAVLRGQDAIELLPPLSQLSKVNLTVDDLAVVLEYLTPPKRNKLPLTLDAIHTSGGLMRVEILAELAACSERQLNRVFRSQVGLSTKTYAQLVQFHRTLGLIQREKLSLKDAAFEGGYADQPHLTRAFKRFGGFSPSNIPPELSLPGLFSNRV